MATKKMWILTAALALTMAAPAARGQAQQPQAIAITGGRILTVTHGVIQRGTVLVENGRIAAVGESVQAPKGARVIDAAGKVVIPGFFDAGDNLGLVEIPAEAITVDDTEYNSPLHPELRVLDALNPTSEVLRVVRAAGITNALSMPALGNLISGQSAVIQLEGNSVEDLVVKSPAALHINLGEPSKMIYGRKGKAPQTRMGQMAMLRQEFLAAQHYRAVQQAFAGGEHSNGAGSAGEQSGHSGANAKAGPKAPPSTDLKMEAMLLALDAKIPVVVRAARASDIEMAMRLADEFHLRLIVDEGASAWRLASDLAARKIPVIVGPVLEQPGRMETLDVRRDNAAILYKAGVPIAFQSESVDGVRDLPFQVEYAIGAGLPDDAALAAVTINPARFYGVDSSLGSIEAGKQANLLVLDGAPFRVKTHVITELIQGKVIDLSNHQTRLYDYYRKKYGISGP